MFELENDGPEPRDVLHILATLRVEIAEFGHPTAQHVRVKIAEFGHPTAQHVRVKIAEFGHPTA